ncbi:NADH:ubiquinone oxidoreductase [Hypocenomyce scalaris]|nr:NADH:ubiquinone oxidoreductase [Hypocenomyce scalaris]
MGSVEEPPSSPAAPNASTSSEDALAYYKSQYEQLEAELADFQASSRELEAELERDVDASEKRERQLQEKVESLGFEVDEWKSKYKQSKAEANGAQNTLQKEVTALRDTNRTIQLKLRDIEVANDDFERQARNTTSSLEDLESKYNVAIERGVMLEEEIKLGEQEREALRIETQRLRDELSDLKVEAEIMQDKLRHAGGRSERQLRKPTPLGAGIVRPQSPVSENSPATTTSSPTIATPPTKSASSTASDAPTPPSPPVSDTSIPASSKTTTALPQAKSRLSISNSNTTPRPSHYSSRPPRHSRGPSIPLSNGQSTPSIPRRTTIIRPDGPQQPSLGLPHSGSLHQIRGLIGKMQKLEQRVHSARSKLPAPTMTPPRGSPRSGSAIRQSYIPASVTVRSHKKRTGGSNAAGSFYKESASESTPLSTQHVSRLSVGGPTATPTRDNRHENTINGAHASRPSSRASLSGRSSMSQLTGAYAPTASSNNRPSSRLGYTAASSSNTRPSSRQGYAAGAPSNTRPSSRQGYPATLSSTNNRPSSRQGAPPPAPSSSSRPPSRQSVSGTRTPLGQYSSSTLSESRRPRSSIGGSYAAQHGHVHSASVNHIRSVEDLRLEEEGDEVLTPTPRGGGKGDVSAIPTPKGLGGNRLSGVGRRTSSGLGVRREEGDMGPPEWRGGGKKLSGVGESY